MAWIKKGVVLDPQKYLDLPDPITQLPCILDLPGDLIRVYFSFREHGCSRPAFFELNLETLDLSTPPCLEIGLDDGFIGTFDEHGVMPSSIVRINKKEIWMYYIGWSKGGSIPYRLSIGLAQSFDNGITFKKYSPGPIIAQAFDEPFYATCPHVQRFGKSWCMWYSSGEAWIEGDQRMESRYIIKYRESRNGIDWSFPIIPFEQNTDAASAAPSFCQINDQELLWYSERNVRDFRDSKEASYRIRAMRILDKNTYARDEAFDLPLSDEGWDSEMTTYSQVFKKNNKVYMLYNGNKFGRTGIGLAEWVND